LSMVRGRFKALSSLSAPFKAALRAIIVFSGSGGLLLGSRIFCSKEVILGSFQVMQWSFLTAFVFHLLYPTNPCVSDSVLSLDYEWLIGKGLLLGAARQGSLLQHWVGVGEHLCLPTRLTVINFLTEKP
jgi:hypothetical protein